MVFRRDVLTLLTDQPRSVSSLARALGVPRADVEDDLRHVIRTARATGYTVRLLPARCKACGFEFGEDKLGKPGKCPACRGSRIYEAQVHIDQNPQR
jgi:predicted Zn-ribbon and HTH transcriptional regulator